MGTSPTTLQRKTSREASKIWQAATPNRAYNATGTSSSSATSTASFDGNSHQLQLQSQLQRRTESLVRSAMGAFSNLPTLEDNPISTIALFIGKRPRRVVRIELKNGSEQPLLVELPQSRFREIKNLFPVRERSSEYFCKSKIVFKTCCRLIP